MKPQRDKYQKDWEQKSRERTKREVNDAWSHERKNRKESGQPLIVGYKIAAGKYCPHAKPYDGLAFLIEDVYDEPDLLPPYEGCKHNTCQCKYTSVMSDEGGKARFVFKFADPEFQAKLTTRRTSPVGWERGSRGKQITGTRDVTWKKKRKKPAGCTPVVLAAFALLLLAGLVSNLL